MSDSEQAFEKWWDEQSFDPVSVEAPLQLLQLRAGCGCAWHARDAEVADLETELEMHKVYVGDLEADNARLRELLGRAHTAMSTTVGCLPFGTGELLDEILAALANETQLQEEVGRLRAALENIVEYWNRSETYGAMSDALHHIIGVAEDALGDCEVSDGLARH